jgi:tetratricopeptide (TPR) repeat protein
LAISEEVNDSVTTFLSSYWYGANLCLSCEFEQGTRYLKKALDISIAANNPRGIASTKASFAYFSYFNQGMIGTGFKTSIEAVQIAEDSRDDYSKGIAHTCHGVLCFGRRRFEDAARHLATGIGFCEKVREKGWNFLAHWCLGEIYLEVEDFHKAEEWYEKGCRLLQDSLLFPSLICWGQAGVINAKSNVKPKEIDLEFLYSLSGTNQYQTAQGWILSYIGTALMNLGEGRASEAAAWLKKAIQEDRKNGTQFFLGRDYISYGKLLKRKGARIHARQCFNKAINILRDCGADGWVRKTEQERATL